MTLYKPRCIFQVDVPSDNGMNFEEGHRAELYPQVQTLKWSKNNHLAADELTVTIDYRESGIDPRLLRNGRGSMWLWDDQAEQFDRDKHYRFQGVVVKAARKGSESGMFVDLTLHDYTSFFINMKPFPSKYYPDWTDSLKTAWYKILDGTGYRDPNNRDNVISSVRKAFDHKGGFVVASKVINEDTIIGSIVPDRFHKIGKPTYPNRADAWAVWQWIMSSLGLVSYIDKTTLFVTTTSEFYGPRSSGVMVWGKNILDFEETVDCGVTNMGIHLTSYDHLKNQIIESFYPPPDDETIKKTQAAAKRIAKGTTLAENEEAVQYTPYERFDIVTQEGLDVCAKSTYEIFKRQELEGKLTTHEMRVTGADGVQRDLISYGGGDAITIKVDNFTYDSLKDIPDEDSRVDFLERSGLNTNAARAIARNFGENAFLLPVFHIGSLEVELSETKWSCDIKFHNILLDDSRQVINVEGFSDDPTTITVDGWDDAPATNVINVDGIDERPKPRVINVGGIDERDYDNNNES